MLNTSAIIAIVVLFIGIVLFIIGIILFEINVQRGNAQSWWVWAMLIAGLLLAIVGGIWLAFAVRTKPATVKTVTVEHHA